MKLGTKLEEPKTAAPVQAGHVKDVSYPGFCLNDKLVEQFMEEHKVKMGDELTATVRLKVVGMSDETYGKSLRFDVLELSDTKDKPFEDKDSDEQYVELQNEAEKRDRGEND
jgi:hypothetical protein